ncbi:hypothetical protein RX411_08140 [Faecalibacterium prausnitzii]|jgi:hypothetical protein|uniref:hypothetical protein n=1 Tax=Faecalibacterium prausnitzii TaxID=853 RepID=UPI00204E58B3|nr:hypothetical protein [Faecalibacterium prausnitzii]DAU42658.1 MAG TPA: hypothetical protein [Caudoviricetes sp.]
MKEHGNLRKDVDSTTLDNLVLELRCDSDMLKAVHVAMVEGPDKAENYTDALFGVLMSLWNLIDKFSDEIYEEVKDHE